MLDALLVKVDQHLRIVVHWASKVFGRVDFCQRNQLQIAATSNINHNLLVRLAVKLLAMRVERL